MNLKYNDCCAAINYYDKKEKYVEIHSWWNFTVQDTQKGAKVINSEWKSYFMLWVVKHVTCSFASYLYVKIWSF